MRKCMESAAIGGEMRIRKRVLFLVPSPKLVDLQNGGEFSHNSTECDGCAQSRLDRGKGNLGQQKQKGGHFLSAGGLGLPGPKYLCTRGPCGLSWAPGGPVLAARYRSTINTRIIPVHEPCNSVLVLLGERAE